MSEIEKNIAFRIKEQFPGIYREDGQELIQLVEDYYRFLEDQPNNATHNSRRMFEYRDITTTIQEMLVFFQKTFLQDLPLMPNAEVRFIVKNILDLYRAKGTEGGIKLFFRIFYAENAKVEYPAKHMFKVSDSQWKNGTYLQMIPNNGSFTSAEGLVYSYSDVINKNIRGAVSGAKAVVDKINFILLNRTILPIVYINNPKGQFQKYDDIVAKINGEEVSFGRVNGSLSDIEIDTLYGGTEGNLVGQLYNVESDLGVAGKVIVTGVSDIGKGEIQYNLTDGGWGYTIAGTSLLVSDQVIVLPNPDLDFVIGETLTDTASNVGVVTGQNSNAVGVRMNAGDEFDISREIGTNDRSVNFNLTGVLTVSAKNSTSPGPILPENNTPATDVQVGSLSNIETVNLITDIIGDFTNVLINSTNYNTVPPALQPMSGTADPVTLATPINQAFALQAFEMGTINEFININPGEEYTNDAFAIIRDYTTNIFDRFEQIISFTTFGSGFSVGDTITQTASGVSGIITGVNSQKSYLNVRAYSYYGFDSTNVITHKGNNYTPLVVYRDYDSEKAGENADMETETNFTRGRITAVDVYNSGLGYVDNESVFITDDDGVIQAKGTASARTQGTTSGFWAEKNSHLNGYEQNQAGTLKYFDASMRLQDSDYYQEYSYEIQSVVSRETYEEPLRNSVHLAGTKMFDKFSWQKEFSAVVTHRFGFNITEDYIPGGDPVVGPGQIVGDQSIRVDTAVLTADNGVITVDIVNG
jgi:hypothetical protein